MKEYKLIKKYPSLPINWEEGMLVGQGDRQNGTYTAEKVNWGKFTNPETMLVFSTKEAAEEYINLKKPYLSNKDVLDEINKCTNIQQLIKVFTNKAAK